MGLGGIGFQELLVIFLLVLLLFGAKRLPEVGKAMGKGIREFKKATKEISAEVDLDEFEKKPGGGSPGGSDAGKTEKSADTETSSTKKSE